MSRPLRNGCMVLLAALAAATAVQAAPAPAAGQDACSHLRPANIEKATFQYAEKGGQRLHLDRIVDTSAKVDGKRPVIVHSVGGGWETGQRDEPSVVPFLNHLASLGYTVISIDYRLGMKAAKENNEVTPTNGVELYLRAVRWGVEDLFDATSYVLRHADDWNLDRDQVVILGGSAGATNSLVAEYNVANETELARARLPAGFRYAGVISMAGAFWLPADTPLTFKSKPAPIMFFHGAKDQLVTYDEVQGPFSGYGPMAFMRRYPSPDYPKWFVDFPGGDHTISYAPMLEHRLEVAAFLQRLVRERQQASIHTVEHDKVARVFANVMPLYGQDLAMARACAAKK